MFSKFTFLLVPFLLPTIAFGAAIEFLKPKEPLNRVEIKGSTRTNVESCSNEQIYFDGQCRGISFLSKFISSSYKIEFFAGSNKKIGKPGFMIRQSANGIIQDITVSPTKKMKSDLEGSYINNYRISYQRKLVLGRNSMNELVKTELTLVGSVSQGDTLINANKKTRTKLKLGVYTLKSILDKSTVYHADGSFTICENGRTCSTAYAAGQSSSGSKTCVQNYDAVKTEIHKMCTDTLGTGLNEMFKAASVAGIIAGIEAAATSTAAAGPEAVGVVEGFIIARATTIAGALNYAWDSYVGPVFEQTGKAICDQIMAEWTGTKICPTPGQNPNVPVQPKDGFVLAPIDGPKTCPDGSTPVLNPLACWKTTQSGSKSWDNGSLIIVQDNPVETTVCQQLIGLYCVSESNLLFTNFPLSSSERSFVISKRHF